MEIQIYVCDDAIGMIRTLEEIKGLATVLYSTQSQQGETGELIRFLVSTKKSKGATLEKFAGKFVVIAMM